MSAHLSPGQQREERRDLIGHTGAGLVGVAAWAMAVVPCRLLGADWLPSLITAGLVGAIVGTLVHCVVPAPSDDEPVIEDGSGERDAWTPEHLRRMSPHHAWEYGDEPLVVDPVRPGPSRRRRSRKAGAS